MPHFDHIILFLSYCLLADSTPILHLEGELLPPTAISILSTAALVATVINDTITAGILLAVEVGDHVDVVILV